MIKGLTSVVIPSRGREERLLKALKSLQETSKGVEVVLVLPSKEHAIQSILGPFKDISVRVLFLPHHEELNTAELWNAGAEVANGEYLVTGANDLVFQPGWLEAAMQHMRLMGGSGVVGLNTGMGFGQLATHVMVSRKYVARRLGGVLFVPHYEHGYVDVELMWRATMDGQMQWAENARVLHEHPELGTGPDDDIYRKGRESRERDKARFDERRAAGFPNDYEPVVEYDSKYTDGWGKVAIGARMYKYPEAEFVESLMFFIAGGLAPGDRLLKPAKGMPGPMAANILAARLLQTDCDSILFLDDDMQFDPKALARIRANEDNHDLDIVQGFCTFKTPPAHAVVYELAEEQPGLPESLNGMRYNALAHIDENSVIDVDAVGLAFTLVKRHVFESQLSQHGPEYTSWFNWGELMEGEDMRFSQNAKALGYKLGVDTHAKIGHVGKYVFGWDEHKRLVQMMESNNG